MRLTLLTFTVLTVFTFGMSASMAQQPKQMDPGTIKVNPPQQPASPPVQTQPAPVPQNNTSQNPYRNNRGFMETPLPPQKR